MDRVIAGFWTGVGIRATGVGVRGRAIAGGVVELAEEPSPVGLVDVVAVGALGGVGDDGDGGVLAGVRWSAT